MAPLKLAFRGAALQIFTTLIPDMIGEDISTP
jgi:hypothetical protein